MGLVSFPSMRLAFRCRLLVLGVRAKLAAFVRQPPGGEVCFVMHENIGAWSTRNSANRARHARIRRRRGHLLMMAPALAVLAVALTVASGLTSVAPSAVAATAAPSVTTTMRPGLTTPKQHPVPKGLPVLENGNGPTPQERAAMVQAATAVRASGKAATVDA